MLSHRPERNRCINYSSGPIQEVVHGSICYSPFSDQIRPIATTTALPFLSHEPAKHPSLGGVRILGLWSVAEGR